MQTIGSKILFTLFFICSLGLSGCGSDTYEGDYTTEVSFQDGENSDMMTLDMYRADCDDDPVEVDLEVFTDVLADITVTIADFAVGLSVNGYIIEYLPVLSADGSGAMVSPPALNSLSDQGFNTIHIEPGTSYTFTTTCFSLDQKEEYRNAVAGYAFLEYPRYTIRIVLQCTDDNGEGRNIEIRRTLYFGDYDNC